MSNGQKSPMELFGYQSGTSPHNIPKSIPASNPPTAASPPVPASPTVPGGKRRRHKTKKNSPGTPQTPPAKRGPVAADMTVLVTRTDLYDSGRHSSSDDCGPPKPPNLGYPQPPVACYRYNPSEECRGDGTVAVCRVNPSTPINNPAWIQFAVVDKSTPNPGDPAITKYWNQRRRLFSRFDQGIQLDQEGWFSVTPEQIADHVASRAVELCGNTSQNITVLDAFCGCGGNSIAFAKQSAVKQVICCDIDRSKLQRAANNAAIYQIPADKIIFIDCNVLFLIEHCYKNGEFILDQPIETPEAAMAMMSEMPPPVITETCHGYQIGGIDILPRKIDAIFMDPPWGGVDYEVFGKNGYCLQRNMRIQRPIKDSSSHEGVGDSFFDTFSAEPRNKKERKAAFNCGLDERNCVNGAELLKLAAVAASNGLVIYDLPRNTSRTSLAQSALIAGYRGNCKLEEHYLNGRLKTITSYFGCDWRSTLLPENRES